MKSIEQRAREIAVKLKCADTKKGIGVDRLDAGEMIAQALREVVEEAIAKVKVWQDAYPVDVFEEPEPGKHGKTVDGCSARMGRHMAKKLIEEIREIGV